MLRWAGGGYGVLSASIMSRGFAGGFFVGVLDVDPGVGDAVMALLPVL